MTQVQPTLKAVDFLGELPRMVLTEVNIDENLYRELAKGKSWDRALSILCNVDACSMYPASTQPCQRWSLPWLGEPNYPHSSGSRHDPGSKPNPKPKPSG